MKTPRTHVVFQRGVLSQDAVADEIERAMIDLVPSAKKVVAGTSGPSWRASVTAFIVRMLPFVISGADGIPLDRGRAVSIRAGTKFYFWRVNFYPQRKSGRR